MTSCSRPPFFHPLPSSPPSLLSLPFLRESTPPHPNPFPDRPSLSSLPLFPSGAAGTTLSLSSPPLGPAGNSASCWPPTGQNPLVLGNRLELLFFYRNVPLIPPDSLGALHFPPLPFPPFSPSTLLLGLISPRFHLKYRIFSSILAPPSLLPPVVSVAFPPPLPHLPFPCSSPSFRQFYFLIS